MTGDGSNSFTAKLRRLEDKANRTFKEKDRTAYFKERGID